MSRASNGRTAAKKHHSITSSGTGEPRGLDNAIYVRADDKSASPEEDLIGSGCRSYCISMFQNTGTGACSIPTTFLRIRAG
jgi:hypothetical protein